MNKAVVSPWLCALALACSTVPALAQAEGGSGYFRMADNKQEYRHAVALSRESASEPGKRKVNLYLTTHAVDATAAATAFDLDDAVTEQLRAVSGGMTRVTINPDGSDGGIWFWSSEPSDTFNTSGFGKLSVTTHTAIRIEGSHVLAEPEDFFDKTYQFDLKFAVDVTPADFAGTALGVGGGAPGAAWLAWTHAVAKGDVDTLREQMGESAQWMLPKDDAEASKSYIETLRYSTPIDAKVTRGWLQEDVAVIAVEGKDSDGNTQRGVVRLVKDGERWKEDGKDISTIWK
jgi:hypothetical protein